MIPDSKIIVNTCCKHCHNEDTLEIQFRDIFQALQNKIPATKGPIESIYAMIERKKALKSQIECMPY